MNANIKVKLFLRVVFITLIGLFFYQCDDISDSEIEGDDINQGSYIVINSSDPEFIKLITDKGEIINIFGERDENGLPKLVKQINITNEQGEEYIYFYDNNKRLTKAIADNGTIFEYEWLSNSKVALNIICNDGINQINTEINLDELESEKSIEINTNAEMRSSEGHRSDIEFFPSTNNSINTQQHNLNAIAGYGTTHHLYVTQCGAPIFIKPYKVLLYDQSGSVLLKELIAEDVAKGHYKIVVPDGSAPTVDPQAMVNKLTAILTYYCDAEGLLGSIISPASCAAIAAKLALTGIGTSVAPQVGIACVGITAALKIYCATLGKSAGIGAPSPMDKINEQNLLKNFKLVGNMRLYTTFHGLPKNITKGFTIAEGVPSNLNAELAEDAIPRINSLVLSPSAPSANQSYTISVSVFCIPIGSTISISMSGTDGYSQQMEYKITDSSQSVGTYKMTVLGAKEAGVKDVIVVDVITADGTKISRTASLIFGK